MLDELEDIHRNRKVRKAIGDALFTDRGPKLLNVAIEENQGHRSRAVEIKMSAARPSSLLEMQVDDTVAYIRTRHRAVLRELKNVAERKGTIDSVLAPVVRKLKEYKRVSDYADLVIQDLDQAKWSLQNRKELISIERRI